MRRHLFALLALVTIANWANAQQADIAGTWDVVLGSPNGDVPLKIIMKFEGDKLVASIAGANGETPMKAKLDGKVVTLAFNAPPAFNSIEITMTGTIDGNTIKGTVDYSGFAQAEWSAKRLS